MRLQVATLATLALVGTQAVVLTPDVYSQVFCNCDNCCQIEPIDFATSNEVKVDNKGSVTWTVNAENYNTVAGLEVHRHLTHFDIVARGPVVCTSSIGYVANLAGTMSAKVVTMEQTDVRTCRVNWNGVFESSAAYANFDDIYVFFAFKDVSNGNRKVYIVPDTKTNILTQHDLNRPLFVTDVFSPVEVNNNVGLQVKLRYYEARDEAECPLPDSIIVQMGECNAFTLPQVASGSDDKTYRFVPSNGQFKQCATRREETQDQIRYTVPLTILEDEVSLDSGCDSTRRLVQVNTTEFYVEVSINLDGSTRIEEISNLRTAIVDRGVLQVCDGLFSPQAVMYIDMSTTVTDAQFDQFVFETVLYLEDATFELDESSISCTQSGSTHECSYRYVSASCLLMENTEDGQGQVTCQFQNLGLITTDITYSRTDQTTSAEYSFSDMVALDTSYTTCATPATTVNLDSEFPVEVTAQSRGAMNEPITVEMRFTDPEMGPDAETTFKIYKVIVTHPSATRKYEVNTKIALMASSASPYYSDAHFCRFEPEGSDSCEPFYDSFSNALTEGQDATFGVVGHGHVSCQNINTRNIDRFTFTPNEWTAFEQLVEETSVTLDIQVFATLDTCLPSEATRRLLQNQQASDSEYKIVSGSTTITIGSSQDSYKPGLPAWAVVLLALGSVLACCCGGGFVFLRRRRRREEQERKPEGP